MKEENKMYAKPQYKCAICGKIYDNVQGRMNCEMECLKKQKEEERAAAEAKKKAEKDSRYNEVNAALDNAYALVNKYVEDYGSFTYGGKYKGLDILNMDLFPSKFLHHFLF
jgi:rubredoxin